MSAETLLCDPVLRHGWDGIGRCTFAAAKVLHFFDICKFWGRKIVQNNDIFIRYNVITVLRNNDNYSILRVPWQLG